MRDGLGLHREHVVAELGAGHEAVAPVEVALAATGVLEHVDVNGLSAAGLAGAVGIGDDGGAAIGEGARGAVADGYAYLLAVGRGVVGGVVEVVIATLLDDGGGPGVARGPGDLVALDVEHLAFVSPVNEVRGGENAEVVAAPARGAVGGAVDVVLTGLVGVEHFRVGMEAREDGLTVVAKLVEQALLLGAGDGDDGAVTGGEAAPGLGVLHKLEGREVFGTAELVVAVAVAVVHDDPRTAVDGLAHADALDGFLGLLHVAGKHLPLVGELTGHGLIDAAP